MASGGESGNWRAAAGNNFCLEGAGSRECSDEREGKTVRKKGG